MPESNWVRVNRAHPCPVCGKPDWCLFTRDGGAAICPRTESGTDLGESGFLHRLREHEGDRPGVDRKPHRSTRDLARRSAVPDLTKLSDRFRSLVTDRSLEMLSEKLGPAVPVSTLKAFGVGWSRHHMAWSIPSWNPLVNAVTGIQLRRVDGGKLSVKGSRYALYCPRELAYDPTLLICEGASDAMSGYTLGFRMVCGRHNCKSGVEYIVNVIVKRKPVRVVIVADGDDHGAGLDGAMSLAEKLAVHHKDVVVFLPPEPFKDLRAWANSGATRTDVEGRR